MKVYGRYGAFTPRSDQAGIYAKRAKKQKQQRADAARSLVEWLERHKTCANGCGKPVAFYDTVHYSLKHGGCCSAECEAARGASSADASGVSVVDGQTFSQQTPMEESKPK